MAIKHGRQVATAIWRWIASATNMPMLAICSSRVCTFKVVLQEVGTGKSIPTPGESPICGSAVLARCPSCHFKTSQTVRLRAENMTYALQDQRISKTGTGAIGSKSRACAVPQREAGQAGTKRADRREFQFVIHESNLACISSLLLRLELLKMVFS
jgi:hypothetical protein